MSGHNLYPPALRTYCPKRTSVLYVGYICKYLEKKEKKKTKHDYVLQIPVCTKALGLGGLFRFEYEMM